MTVYSPLLTDFYQLTMAYGYWRLGMAEREAVFHLFYRRNPFQGNYALNCGLASVIDYLQHWQFTSEEIDYLQTLCDIHQKPLFEPDFLDYLRELRFTADLFAIPEGEVVFANEPLLRVQGPILQAQLIETPLVNRINFATLIATKASRVCAAALGDPVIEFGLRRAQGPDGGMTASRAAFIGGCRSVSNTLAAMQNHIPPQGTMAHSWIMAFSDELTAFQNFAEVMAGNAVLLVDTYDTLHGVQNAIAVGKELREKGSDLLAIRLDSGDLNTLSKQSRQLLNAAGFTQTKIMASGDLDEYEIARLKQQGAPIDIWGVGTRMTTAYDQPALDAAYKLSAIRDEQGSWQYKLKSSNNPAKTTNPGIQQVRRYNQGQTWLQDVIYDIELGIAEESSSYQDLLMPIFLHGELIYQSPSIGEIQNFARDRLTNFNTSKMVEYSIQLEPQLQTIKNKLLKRISDDNKNT